MAAVPDDDLELTVLRDAGEVTIALAGELDHTLVPGPRHVQDLFELTETRALFSWRDY